MHAWVHHLLHSLERCGWDSDTELTENLDPVSCCLMYSQCHPNPTLLSLYLCGTEIRTFSWVSLVAGQKVIVA